MDQRVLTARHYATGRWVRVACDGPVITKVAEVQDPGLTSDLDPWIALAFWDLQVNGRWGVSFSDATVTPEQVVRIAQAQAELGTARFCPTLITASHESLLAGVTAIAQACDANPRINHQVLGIHLEGPWISPIDGYRGAHPRDHVREADWAEFEELQQASGNRIVMITLAPECPGTIGLIARLRRAGVRVAIGHSSANSEVIDQAVGEGATIATHLGNGVPAILPRHPNPIWDLAARRKLWSSFIADGAHLDWATLRVLIQSRPERSFVVSDASPLAGSEPGLYGPWEVRPDRRIVVAGTPYLAGSNSELLQAVENLIRYVPLSQGRAFDLVSVKPAQVMRMKPPRLEAGSPSDLVLFRREASEAQEFGTNTFQLLASCVYGMWTSAGVNSETAASGD